MGNLKFDLLPHLAGDFHLVLSEYESADGRIYMAGPFSTPDEVLEEFGKLEKVLARAKTKAIRAAEKLAEEGILSAADSYGKFLKKADPTS